MRNELSKEYTGLDVVAVLKQPPLYQVVMHNDDFTPMEFVVDMLQRFFFMERRTAIEVMSEIHMLGKAACGFFSRDVAESKIADVTEQARKHEYPLLCSMLSE